jgi:hypothetical protein
MIQWWKLTVALFVLFLFCRINRVGA